jgi:hypothetical protein
VILSGDQRLVDAVAALVDDAGARPLVFASADHLDGYAGPPRVIVCGGDVDGALERAIRQAWPGRPVLRAAFGAGEGTAGPAGAPGPDSGGGWDTEELDPVGGPAGPDTGDRPEGDVHLLPASGDNLVQAIEAALAGPRSGVRIGVIGATGGVGASTLATALTREVAALGSPASLVDLDPGGGPLEALLGLDDSGCGWGELLAQLARRPDRAPDGPAAGGAGSGAAGGRMGAGGGLGAGAGRGWEPDLGVWRGVCLLPGPGAIPPCTPARVIRAGLEAVDQARPGGVAVVDFSRAAPVTLRRFAGWCDHLVVVVRADGVGEAALIRIAAETAPAGCPVTLAVRPVKGGARSAELARLARASSAIVLPHERGLAGAAELGIAPGDRAHGTLSRTAATLARDLLGLESGPAGLAIAAGSVAWPGEDDGAAAPEPLFGGADETWLASSGDEVFAGAPAGPRGLARWRDWRSAKPPESVVGAWEEDW